MKILTTILLCIMLNMGTYDITYSSIYNGNAVEYVQYSTTSSPYQYEFKSTSAYTPITSYQTVKPIGNDGFVSSEYTIQGNFKRPKKIYGNLDLDDDDDPNLGTTPIDDPPMVMILLFAVLYVLYESVKTRSDEL